MIKPNSNTEEVHILNRVRKFIIDKLKNDYTTKRYSKSDYTYLNTINREVLNFYNRTNKMVSFNISEIDRYSAVINLSFRNTKKVVSFDGRVWIRENSLKKLLD